MKPKLISVLIISLIVLFFLFSCSKQSSPEDTMKVILDNIVNGDVDAALSYFIDEKGNPISPELKQNMKESAQRNPIASYQISGIKDLDTSLPEFSNLNMPILKGAKVVSFSMTEKGTQRIQESQLIMVQYQGAWKVLMATQSLPQPS